MTTLEQNLSFGDEGVHPVREVALPTGIAVQGLAQPAFLQKLLVAA
jgi:hypothetical protein